MPRGSEKDYAYRAAIAKFSADHFDATGRLPTVSEAAAHFHKNYEAMYSMAVNMANREQIFATSRATHPAAPKMSPPLRRKWRFWGDVVRTLYPNRGER